MLCRLLIVVFVLSLMCIVTGASAQVEDPVLLWYMADVRPDTPNSCGPGLQWGRYAGVDEGSLVDDENAWDGKAWYIHDTNDKKDHWRTGNHEFASSVGGTIVARVRVTGESSAGGNIGFLENGGMSAEYHWGGSNGHVKETQRGNEVDVANGSATYRIIRMTAIRSSSTGLINVKLYLDENTTPVLDVIDGVNVGGTGCDAFMFGSTGTGGTQDIYFDWITGSNRGCFAPGEEVAVIGKSLVPPRDTARTVDECKKIGSGAIAELSDMVVTSITCTLDVDGQPIPNGFTVENQDRSAGIRVSSDTGMFVPGDIVDISGTVATSDGERIVVASYVDRNSPDNPIPDPLCLSNRASGGGTYGEQQAVVDDASQTPPKMSAGMNTVGILMKLTGKVTAEKTDSSILENYVYIDDGSGLNDGSGYTGIKCSPASDDPPMWGTQPPLGSYVSMTGVMGVRKINGINARYFLCLRWQPIPTIPD